jgi:hypothetical protein
MVPQLIPLSPRAPPSEAIATAAKCDHCFHCRHRFAQATRFRQTDVAMGASPTGRVRAGAGIGFGWVWRRCGLTHVSSPSSSLSCSVGRAKAQSAKGPGSSRVPQRRKPQRKTTRDDSPIISTRKKRPDVPQQTSRRLSHYRYP